MPTWVQWTIWLGGVAAAATSIAVFIERVFGPVRKWLWNALTRPLLVEMREIKTELKASDTKLVARDASLERRIDHLHDSFDEHRDYVEGHLGPNGKTGTPPLHTRVGRLEADVAKIRDGYNPERPT